MPPRSRQKFRPFLPPHAGPCSEPVSTASQRPPLLIFPMAPMCLSAGITLTNAFTHFPQKSALQAAAPLVLEAKTLQRHPRQGEEEILARSPVARGRGASLGHPSARVSCALLTLVSRDQSRSLGYPEAEALAYLHQEGSRLRSWFQKTPQETPRPRRTSRGGLGPKDPQILRDPKRVVQM